MNNFPILSFLIISPLIGIFTLLIMSKDNNSIKNITLSFCLVNLSISLGLMLMFDYNYQGFHYVEKLSWIKSFNINYHLGIDGISLLMINLTNILIILCVYFGNIKTRYKEYLIYFLLLQMSIIGVFAALDFVLFYIFFEAMLVPMFFIIGIWGGSNRIYAAYKFFLYTFIGSLFLLVALIYIYIETESMDISYLPTVTAKFSFEIQKYLFLCFFASFAIKIPMWPFHTWLPDAHVQAPTTGSMILAGIMIKIGAYGFLRFSLPMLPDASLYFKDIIYILSSIAVIYASLVAFIQEDIKKVIAYSSVAHMGFVTAGIFSFNKQGITGAIIQMISHGIVSAGLFFTIGIIYERMHTREILRFGGIAWRMPKYALFFMIFTMASVGLPGTSGFVGEFMIFLGVFLNNKICSIFIITAMVLSAIYMLYLYKRTMFGEANSETSTLIDISKNELIIYSVLTSCIVIIGIYPKIITIYLAIPVTNLLTNILQK